MSGNLELTLAVEEKYADTEISRHYATAYPSMPDRLCEIVRWLDVNMKSAGFAFMVARLEGQAAELQSSWEKRFALTPAEIRLAAHLVNSGTLATYAKARELSRNTARNQLQAIYCKTGTHRQAELVSLLLKG